MGNIGALRTTENEAKWAIALSATAYEVQNLVSVCGLALDVTDKLHCVRVNDP